MKNYRADRELRGLGSIIVATAIVLFVFGITEKTFLVILITFGAILEIPATLILISAPEIKTPFQSIVDFVSIFKYAIIIPGIYLLIKN